MEPIQKRKSGPTGGSGTRQSYQAVAVLRPIKPARTSRCRRRAGGKGSGMHHTGIDDMAVWPSSQFGETEPAADVSPWQDTIAAADQALEEATRIQRGVQNNLKLMQEVRSLREELRKAHAEVDRYRGMHARVVVGMRQLEDDHTAAMSRLQADHEMLMVRHRVYRLMAEHYARTALGLDPETFVAHRERVLQHVLFQRRRGVPPEAISAADVAFLML